MDREKSLCEMVIEEAKLPYGNDDLVICPTAFHIFSRYGYWSFENGTFQWNFSALLTAPQNDLLYMLNWDKEVKND